MSWWSATIAGEPASKANSRKVVKIGGRIRVVKSAKAQLYARTLARQVRPLPELLRGPLIFYATIFYATMRPDLDVSLILDGLQGRVYKNDRQVVEMHLVRKLDRTTPRAVVRVETMDAADSSIWPPSRSSATRTSRPATG